MPGERKKKITQKIVIVIHCDNVYISHAVKTTHSEAERSPKPVGEKGYEQNQLHSGNHFKMLRRQPQNHITCEGTKRHSGSTWPGV
jgi:hypothetical protein